ncbi:MAG: transglycosylase SLT domain-containing protein [Rhodanobacteraceae bacterium]|nr:transglycosylase SLT domain-containing protein [Rhodanobacteraceae bacterium]
MRCPARLRHAPLGAALLLAACTAPPVRPPPPAAPAPTPPTAEQPTPSAPAAPVPDAHATQSPWPRLRQRFALNACAYRPEVQRWVTQYAKAPLQFNANWTRAMPFLLLVVDEIERRDLPGELAMLPYVESDYRPVPARGGDRPAGMWQLMPDTARNAGLAVRADFDERLDAQASTRAALDLLERHHRQFDDWRLANMAFNSGEYRVRRLLGGRDANTLSAAELAKLALSPTTHDHLDRLLALACIVETPERFGLKLPEPGPDDRVRAIALEAGMDIRVAAHLAGIPVELARRLNAGYRRNRMPPDGPHRLLLPESSLARFHATADAIPVALWNDWHEERAVRTSGIGSWASQLGLPVAVLAAANALDPNTSVNPSMRLLLPGREADPPPDDAAARASARSPRVHVVAAGDTLSHVARRYSIPLARLKRLNPQAGTLRPGDRLRLSAE